MDQHSEITLPDGGTTALHVSRADGSTPFVLVLPAMGVPAGYYGPFVDELARHGVTAGVADYPGQGGARPLAGRGQDLGYTELAHEWLPAVVESVREGHDGPVVALGHSLGGHVLAAHLAGEQPAVDAVVLIGSGSTHWRSQQGLKTLAQTQLIGTLSRVLGYWPGTRLGFGGTQPMTLMREWAAFAAPGGWLLVARTWRPACRLDSSRCSSSTSTTTPSLPRPPSTHSSRCLPVPTSRGSPSPRPRATPASR